MDGLVIQQASQQALDDGATPVSILHEVRALDVQVPLAVMLYYNTVHHAGHERFAAELADAGIVAAIVPDLPLDSAGTSFDLPGGTLFNGRLDSYKPISSFRDPYFRDNVAESIAHSWYDGEWTRHPFEEETVKDMAEKMEELIDGIDDSKF